MSKDTKRKEDTELGCRGLEGLDQQKTTCQAYRRPGFNLRTRREERKRRDRLGFLSYRM